MKQQKSAFVIFLLLSMCLTALGCEQIRFLINDPSSAPSVTTPRETSSKATDSFGASSVEPSSQASLIASSEVSSQAASSRSTTVYVTVTEGMTMADVFKLLEENGVCKASKLWKTASSYDYTYYPLVDAIPLNEHRCFLLEGYLFPDTYEFYFGMKPEDAIGRFLRNAEAKWTDEMRRQAVDSGYTVDRILTIASIIEKECGVKSEMRHVSSVLHNRLSSGMKLQCDVTINYVEYEIKPFITGDINRYNEFYNTYKCSALPAGPICSPGMNAIKAALDPLDTDDLYFAANKDGVYAYAETFEQHQKNLADLGI
ncbi:MAG TPA: endolytic transglycosylase MltG [Oscillospiraceae bacterium]|nr:endolytic transglycosylase MltG [Oscillospiraceae bacterium]